MLSQTKFELSQYAAVHERMIVQLHQESEQTKRQLEETERHWQMVTADIMSKLRKNTHSIGKL
jgi:hypothetical protein